MRFLNLRVMVEIAVMLGLAAVLGMIKIYQAPWGGSVSLEMLPLFIVAYRWGLGAWTDRRPGLRFVESFPGWDAFHCSPDSIALGLPGCLCVSRPGRLVSRSLLARNDHRQSGSVSFPCGLWGHLFWCLCPGRAKRVGVFTGL